MGDVTETFLHMLGLADKIIVNGITNTEDLDKIPIWHNLNKEDIDITVTNPNHTFTVSFKDKVNNDLTVELYEYRALFIPTDTVELTDSDIEDTYNGLKELGVL